MESSQLLKEITIAASRKGYHALDLFAEYDSKKCGYISMNQFHRILSWLGVWFDNSKLQKAIQNFSTDAVFYYQKFFSSVNPTGADKHLDENKLRTLKKELAFNGMTIATCFDMYDPLKTGRVDKNSFLKALSFSSIAMDACQTYYIDATNEVNYKMLNSDLMMVPQTPQKQTVHLDKTPPFMEAIAKAASKNFVSLPEAFARADRYKHYQLPLRSFLHVLLECGIDINDNEARQIATIYGDGQNIDYEKFCQALSLFSEPSNYRSGALDPSAFRNQQYDSNRSYARTNILVNQQRNGSSDPIVELKNTLQRQHSRLDSELLAGPPQLDARSFFGILGNAGFRFDSNDSRIILNAFSDDGGYTVNVGRFVSEIFPKKAEINPGVIVARLKEFLTRRKFVLRPTLERLGGREIDLMQLLAVLRDIQFDLDKQEEIALMTTYGRVISIDRFCRDVDPPAPTFRPKPEPEEQQISQRRVFAKNSDAISNQLYRAQNVLNQTETDIVMELRRADRLRRGTVPRHFFENAFYSLPVRISQSDIETIASFYTNEDGGVMYVQFAEDAKKALSQNKTSEVSVSEVPDNFTKTALTKLKSNLVEAKLTPYDVFRAYTSNNLIHSSKLIHALGFGSSQFSDAEVGALCRAFADRRLPEYVDWARIQDALQSVEAITAEQAPTHIVIAAVDSIKSRLALRHRHVRDFFPPDRAPVISAEEFRRRLDSLGVTLSPRDVLEMTRTYKCNVQGDINWARFCNDCE